MKIFKRIAAGLVAVATIASLSVSAFADKWSINYINGAPSSISNQVVRREYIGLSKSAAVYVSCYVNLGDIKLTTDGFNPNLKSMYIYGPTQYHYSCVNPNTLGCWVEICAVGNRVTANGYIIS